MRGGGRLVVVRPEPGLTRTLAAIAARGLTTEAMPLFATEPLAWSAPDASGFDALLLTSAATVRHGGDGLAGLRALPVYAVGAATAAAARAAGFVVAATGTADAAAIAAAAGGRRLLHLGGRERVAVPGAMSIAVYANVALPPPDDAAERLRDATVLLHSARAAQAVAALASDRGTTAVAAISPAALAAAGPGWRAAVAAARPTDAALIDAAAAIDRGGHGGDKPAAWTDAIRTDATGDGDGGR